MKYSFTRFKRECIVKKPFLKKRKLKKMTVFLGLGSNIGHRRENLSRAINLLPPLVTVLKKSSLHKTEPQYYIEQPNFLNQVIEVETSLAALDLLLYLKAIEKKMGRQPSVLYGPRLIDMDILYYGQEIIQTPFLKIPHPEIEKRDFVLFPLHELAPHFQCPVTKKSVHEMVAKLKKD